MPDLANTAYLDALNSEQRRAVEYGVGDDGIVGAPLLVIAGAGSGKTNTLAQASMKLGEAMYKQQAESDAARDAAKDDVVDAEFTEVDDDKKKSA